MDVVWPHLKVLQLLIFFQSSQDIHTNPSCSIWFPGIRGWWGGCGEGERVAEGAGGAVGTLIVI